MKRAILALLVGLAVGFFLGRESVQKETIVRHHKGEKVTGKARGRKRGRVRQMLYFSRK